MQQWEYLHVRATVGIPDYFGPPHLFERKEYAVFHVNGQEFNLDVDASRVDIQNSVIELLNRLGKEGWELVSAADRSRDAGMLPAPTEYTFFLKRAVLAATD